MPETTITDDFAELIRREYLEPEGDWAVSRVQRVMRAAGRLEGETMLDLGCAFGTFLHHGTAAGARAVGLDRSAASLWKGRAVARHYRKPEPPRIQGDARFLPFRDGGFDVLINADFIEHLTDAHKELVFAEMYRVLRPGARGLVYSPNVNRIRWELRGERIKKLLGLRRDPVPRWQEFVDPDHFGMIGAGRADRMLRRAGFATRRQYYEFHVPLLSRVPGFDSLAQHFLGRWFANRYLIALKKPFSA